MWQVSSRHDLAGGQVSGRGRRRRRALYYGIYLRGLDDRLLPTWYGHTGLELLFLAAGVLFTVPMLSSDPLPAKQGYGGRLLDVAIEMPLHAFFGVVLMMATTPIVEFFATPPASWDLDPMADQKVAGGLAWAGGLASGLLPVLEPDWFGQLARSGGPGGRGPAAGRHPGAAGRVRPDGSPAHRAGPVPATAPARRHLACLGPDVVA